MSRVVRSELFWFVIVLTAAELLLLGFGLPLPHQDLSFYFDGGLTLAHTGRLAVPGSQDAFPTFRDGCYIYPPGFALAVAAWVVSLGGSYLSLLIFTRLCHWLIMIATWLIGRHELGLGRYEAAAIVVSIFPSCAHGRPDLLGALFGALALLCSRRSLVATAACLAAALFMSPAHGVGGSIFVGLIVLMRERSWLRFVALTALTTLGLLAAVALVLTQQGAWQIAWEQYVLYTTIRGGELNPSFAEIGLSRYVIVFSLIPFGLLTFLPAIWVAVKRPRFSECSQMAIAFLASALFLLAVNRGPLLLWLHYGFVPVMVLHAAFVASLTEGSRWRKLGVALVLAYAATGFLYYKSDFIYLAVGPQWPDEYERPAGVIVGADAVYFVPVYEPERTLAYISMQGSEDYQAEYERQARARGWWDAAYENFAPPTADWVVISQRTLEAREVPELGPEFERVGEPINPDRVTLFGLSLKNPKYPLKKVVYRRVRPAE